MLYETRVTCKKFRKMLLIIQISYTNESRDGSMSAKNRAVLKRQRSLESGWKIEKSKETKERARKRGRVGTKRNKSNKNAKKKKKKTTTTKKKKRKKGASNTTRSQDTFKSPSGRCQSVVITSGDGKKQGPSSFVVWPALVVPVEEREKTRSGPGDDDCFSRAKLGSSPSSVRVG